MKNKENRKLIEKEVLDLWVKWENGNWFVNDEEDPDGRNNDHRFQDALIDLVAKHVALACLDAQKASNDKLYNLIDGDAWESIDQQIHNYEEICDAIEEEYKLLEAQRKELNK